MNKRNLKNTEWAILICVLLLVIIGLIALYSASQETDLDAFKKQCIWILISIPIMCVAMIMDYNIIARFSWIFYGIFMLLLIVVLFTAAINGATSWFNMGFLSFQPGELAKIFVILFLSYTIVNIQAKGKNQINKPSKLAIILLIGLAPTFLIAIQPDYGLFFGASHKMVRLCADDVRLGRRDEHLQHRSAHSADILRIGNRVQVDAILFDFYLADLDGVCCLDAGTVQPIAFGKFHCFPSFLFRWNSLQIPDFCRQAEKYRGPAVEKSRTMIYSISILYVRAGRITCAKRAIGSTILTGLPGRTALLGCEAFRC